MLERNRKQFHNNTISAAANCKISAEGEILAPNRWIKNEFGPAHSCWLFNKFLEMHR